MSSTLFPPLATDQLFLPGVGPLPAAQDAAPPTAPDACGTIQVAPERLIAQAADGKLGDIAASKAADRPTQGTIRQPFHHTGSLWTVTYTAYDGLLPRCQAVRLIPADTPDATGPVIEFRKQRYMLDSAPIWFEAAPPLAPQTPRPVPSLETLETLLAEFWESGACLLALDEQVTGSAIRSTFARLGVPEGYEFTTHVPGVVLIYDPIRLRDASKTPLPLADYLLQSIYDGSLPAVLDRAQTTPRPLQPVEDTPAPPPCEGPTHTVSPARLLWGTSGTKGDIRLSQSDPRDGVVHHPFLFDSALWVWSGGNTCGDAVTYRLTPRGEFLAPVTSSSERYARDPATFAYRTPRPPEGVWHGLPVRYEEREYILTGPPHRFTMPEPVSRLVPQHAAEEPRALFHQLAEFWTSGDPWLPLRVRCLIPVRALLACLGLSEHKDYGIAYDLPGDAVLLFDLPKAKALLGVPHERLVTDRLVALLYGGGFEALDLAARAQAVPRPVPNAAAEAEVELRLQDPGDPLQDGFPTAIDEDSPLPEPDPLLPAGV